MEEANLGSPPEERTDMLSLHETHTKFELQNKLRPFKGLGDTPKKDIPVISASEPINSTERGQKTDRGKQSSPTIDVKLDSRREIKANKDLGAKLIPPPDTMEKSFNEDQTKKVVIQALDETHKPLITREEAKIDKKMVVTEYVTSPHKKKVLKRVVSCHLEEEESLKGSQIKLPKESSIRG